jgi:hypothetical protein
LTISQSVGDRLFIRIFFSFFSVALLFGQHNTFKLIKEKRAFFMQEHKIEKSRLDFVSMTRLSNSETSYLIQASPILVISIDTNFQLVFAGNILKNDGFFNRHQLSTDYFQLKDFSGLSYYSSEGYLDYRFLYGEIRLGRFYDRVGVAPFENLLIGNHDYHDGYRVKLSWDKLTFTTRFYQLEHYRNQQSINRFLFQHGLAWQVSEELSLEIHESALYSGEHASAPFQFINPISIYHANQLNAGANSNTHYLLAAKYEKINWSIWLEFLLDDFQIDSESEADGNKEPTEFGFLLGAFYKLSNHRFYTQLSILRNRTYNDPHEVLGKASTNKFIDHGQIIGFQKGSNLIDLQIEYWYIISKLSQIQFYADMTNYGDEAVFSNFDKGYNDYEKGFFEPIPYGHIKSEYRLGLSYISTYFQKLTCEINLMSSENNIMSTLAVYYKLD